MCGSSHTEITHASPGAQAVLPIPPNGQGVANPITASEELENPLNIAAKATALLQTDTGFPQLALSEFHKKRQYFVFVPKDLKNEFDKQPTNAKPTAKIALFLGVGPELSLFGLGEFFKDSKDSVLITVPGIEAGWFGKAWGIGVDKVMIEALLTKAQLPNIPFRVEVIAGYSTGYRGVNLTIINKLFDLISLKHLVYFDAFYNHDDYPLSPNNHQFHRKNTKWAIETAIAASPNVKVLIYAFTHPGGVPRTNTQQVNRNIPNPPTGPLSTLESSHPNNTVFIDYEFKYKTKPAVDTELQKISLARLIQGGVKKNTNNLKKADVPTQLIDLIDLLPERGSFGTFGRSGFTDLYAWITSGQAPVAIQKFDIQKAMNVVVSFSLMGGWTTPNHYEFRHRIFVQEIGKEALLP